MDRWWERAACLGKPEEMFFPKPGEKPWEGLKICNGDPKKFTPAVGAVGIDLLPAACPVRTECLKDCLQAETPSFRHGVFGGMSKDDRTKLFGDEEVA